MLRLTGQLNNTCFKSVTANMCFCVMLHTTRHQYKFSTNVRHTILCFPASRIQRMLSLYCCRTRSVTVELMSSSTVVAIASVSTRSAGSPEVQTQRNGPKPSEKISLQTRAKIKVSLWVCVFVDGHLPHYVLDIWGIFKLSCPSSCLLYIRTLKRQQKTFTDVYV